MHASVYILYIYIFTYTRPKSKKIRKKVTMNMYYTYKDIRLIYLRYVFEKSILKVSETNIRKLICRNFDLVY